MRTRNLALVLAFLSAAASASLSAQSRPSASSGPGSSALIGTIIAEPPLAADFSLVDQKGSRFRLSSTRGRVVVLSFLYTHCADLCPFAALKLKAARQLLGAEAAKVVFVAVTTDPARDSPEVIARYSREAGLYEAWHFLTGSVDEVGKVWAAYGIGVHVVSVADLDAAPGAPEGADAKAGAAASSLPEGAGAEAEHSQGLSGSELALARAMIRGFAGGYEVSHSAPFWIIDREGRIRVLLDADALPSDIAADVRALSAP